MNDLKKGKKENTEKRVTVLKGLRYRSGPFFRLFRVFFFHQRTHTHPKKIVLETRKSPAAHRILFCRNPVSKKKLKKKKEKTSP